jgi:hypothetical protein
VDLIIDEFLVNYISDEFKKTEGELDKRILCHFKGYLRAIQRKLK